MFDKDDTRYGPTVCEFWQQNRIPRSPLRPAVQFLRWFSNDSEDNYHRRGNRELAADSVGYEFNTLGYRGPEFVREPGEAIAMFVGDSNTFGLGMPWERLWTSIVTVHLEQRWRVPVRQCNLAWKGTGSDYVAMMVHQSLEVIKPDVVFILWSYITRATWFPDPGRQVHFMPQGSLPGGVEEHSAYLRLATQSQGFFNYVRNFHLVNDRLQRLGIPYYWGDIEHLSTQLLHHYVPLDGYVGTWTRVESDLARDGRHAGLKTHASFAACVVNALERDSVERVEGVYGPASPAVSSSLPIDPEAIATRKKVTRFLARPIRTAVTDLAFQRRVRRMKRRDPFIY